jgi:hypothetical protein
MRTLHVLIILLGLALIALSCRGIQEVREYGALVSQVQKTGNELYQHALRLRPANMSILISPSMESVLSELDSAKKLERGWWVAGGIGCAACVLGLAGIVLSVSRQTTANKPLQATAVPPCC